MPVFNQNKFLKNKSTIIIWSTCFIAIIIWYTWVYDWGPRGILHLKDTHPEMMLAKLDAGKGQPNPDSVLLIKSLLQKLAAQSDESVDTIAASTKGGQYLILKMYGKHRSSIYIMQRVDILSKSGKNSKENFWLGKVQYFDKLKIVLMLEGLRDKFGS